MRTSTTKRILFLCILQLFIFQPAISDPLVVDIVVGGAHILVPTPSGFEELPKGSKNLQSLAEAGTPLTNRLLAIFVSKQDIKRIVSGKSANRNRYFLVQTMRKSESTNVSTQDFRKIKELFNNQQKDMLERNKNKVQQNFNAASLNIQIGETIPLGVFHENASSIGMSALMKYSFPIDGKTEEWPMVMSSIFALAKGKIIFFYAYSIYKSNTDAEWTRSMARQWASSFTNLN